MARTNLERMTASLILLFLSAQPLAYGESGDRIVSSDAQIWGVETLAQYGDDSLGSPGEDKIIQNRDCIGRQRASQSLAARSGGEECREPEYRRREAPLWVTPEQRTRWRANERRMAELYSKQSETVSGNAAVDEQFRQLERQRQNVLRQRRRAVEWEVERGLGYPARPLRD